MTTIGILKEPSFEARVSMLSTEVATLVNNGNAVWVETGAGSSSFCSDEEYIVSGALTKSKAEVLESTEIILIINSDIPASLKRKLLIGSL